MPRQKETKSDGREPRAAGHGPRHLIIAIDGPAGSGKSTVSKMLAQRLGLLYIDTGAMYRALTLKALRLKINLEDEAALTALARDTVIDLKDSPAGLLVFLDGQDVSKQIRTLELTAKVKYIARTPGVRAEMVKLQRQIARGRGAVLEGRDIGTVVFPDADKKFFLDADLKERTRRRLKDMVAAGENADAAAVRQDVETRDRSDRIRSVAPLKQAADAVYIDTTRLSIEQVVERLMSEIKKST